MESIQCGSPQLTGVRPLNGFGVANGTNGTNGTNGSDHSRTNGDHTVCHADSNGHLTNGHSSHNNNARLPTSPAHCNGYTRTLSNGTYTPLMNGSGHGSPVRTPVISGSFYPTSKAPAPAPPPLSLNGITEQQFMNGYVEKFHVNEKPRVLEAKMANGEEEPAYFAGKRDVLNTEHQQDTKIVSAKGTVRGFRNRVKAGIATFLEHQTGTKTKTNFRQLEKGQIVLYSTSMMIVRDTFEKCKMVRNILLTHMVKYEERDICMSRENQRELVERLGVDEVDVPQVFADGQHIGGASEIEKMNETGELRKVFKRFQKVHKPTSCIVCGGYRWIPCTTCHGSKKSLHRNHFTEEFCALRCIICDENGLVKCELCGDMNK